jgi:hypothetical protein
MGTGTEFVTSVENCCCEASCVPLFDCDVDVAAATVHVAAAFGSESKPLVQASRSLAHCCPYATDEDWYAVTDEPLAMVSPFHVHDAAVFVEEVLVVVFVFDAVLLFELLPFVVAELLFDVVLFDEVPEPVLSDSAIWLWSCWSSARRLAISALTPEGVCDTEVFDENAHEDDDEPHALTSAVRVLGPTAPYPVVASLPDGTML